jgi:hypothetical protein
MGKMARRLDHRYVFVSAIQNVLDYFSNRVSKLFLTYRNELIDEADEGHCRRVRLKLLTAADYTEQCEPQTLSHGLVGVEVCI